MVVPELCKGVMLQLHHVKMARVLCPRFRNIRNVATRTMHSMLVREWRERSAQENYHTIDFTIGFVDGYLKNSRILILTHARYSQSVIGAMQATLLAASIKTERKYNCTDY